MLKQLIHKPGIALAVVGFCFFAVVAVGQENTTRQKKESTVKKKEAEEKMTIVIDGDKVTINGEPVTDLHSDLRISPQEPLVFVSNERAFPSAPVPPLPPLPPLAPFEWDGSKVIITAEPRALLGVYSEKDDKGARITDVAEESPAQKAGLQKGDIIIKVDNKTITDPAALSEVIRSFKPEQVVEIQYLREKKKKTVQVTLGEQKEHFNRNFHYEFPQGWNDAFEKNLKFDRFEWNARPKIGIRIQDVEEGKGVKILEVQESSPAEKSGLKKEDIIISIDGKDIENADQAKEKITAVKEKTNFPVKIVRNGVSLEIEIKIPKKLKTADL